MDSPLSSANAILFSSTCRNTSWKPWGVGQGRLGIKGASSPDMKNSTRGGANDLIDGGALGQSATRERLEARTLRIHVSEGHSPHVPRYSEDQRIFRCRNTHSASGSRHAYRGSSHTWSAAVATEGKRETGTRILTHDTQSSSSTLQRHPKAAHSPEGRPARVPCSSRA